MGHQLTELQRLVPGMTPDDPTTGAALLQADVDRLSEDARQLRRHIVDALQASERPAILHPKAALQVLRKGHLRPIRDRWNAYALDRDRRTVRRPHPDGGSRNVLAVSYKAPKPDELPPLPRGGAWLLIWHGGPDVLSIDGVPQRLAYLRQQLPVADVLFYRTDDGTTELYSLAAGRGTRNGQAVEFPDPAAVAAARDQEAA